MVLALQWNELSSGRNISMIKGILIWFMGPFKVIKCISKLAYCIELPPIYSELHNVFYVSKLKVYIFGGGDGTSTNVQLVLVDGEEQYEIDKIVAECGHGNYKPYLVHWVGYSAEHDL